MSPIHFGTITQTEIPMDQTPDTTTAPVATPAPVQPPVATKPPVQQPVATKPPLQPAKQPITQPIKPVAAAPAPAVVPVVAPVEPAVEKQVAVEPPATAPVEDLILPIEVSAKVMALINRIRAISPALLIGIMGLLTYIKSMAPGTPLDEAAGARHQVRLYDALKSLIATPGNNFNLVWGTALTIIEENLDGAFHWNYVCRFLESVTMSNPDVKALETLISLVTQTCAVAERVEMAKGHLESPTPLRRLTASLGADNIQKLRTFYRLG